MGRNSYIEVPELDKLMKAHDVSTCFRSKEKAEEYITAIENSEWKKVLKMKSQAESGAI